MSRPGARVPLIIIGVVLLFLGGLFLAIGGRSVFEEWNYDRHALRSEAVVVGKSLRFATDTTDSAYELSYRTAFEGKSYDRTDVVRVHLWERVEPGSRFDVEYLPGRPDSVRPVQEPGKGGTPSIVWAAIGAVLALGALLAFRKAIRIKAPAAIDAEPSTADAAVAASRTPSYWPLARQSAAFWLGPIFLLVGTPLAVVGAAQSVNEWRFSRDAVSADGIVLTKEIKRSGKGNRTKTYEATYRFNSSGVNFENRTSLAFKGWSRLKERERAEVLYLQDNPSKSRLTGPRSWWEMPLLAAVGLLFAGIGATLFVRSVRQARLEWRLRREGARAEGTITELTDRHLKINDVPQWRLHYEFRDYQGRTHVGTVDVSEEDAVQCKVGDVGTVIYDTRHPSDAIWVGHEAPAPADAGTRPSEELS
jgi:hypothetical protein